MAALTVLVLLAMLAAHDTAVAEPGAFGTYQADAARTGHALGASLDTSLAPAWRFETGFANEHAVIGDGRVYGEARLRPDAPHSIVAIDLVTGRRVWDVPVPSPDMDTWLAYADGRVFVASGEWAEALDARTGKVLWRSFLPWQWVPTSPAVVGDTLYVGMRGIGMVVFALRVSDGARRWRTPLLNGSTVAVAGDVVSSIGTCGHGNGLALSDGSERWHHDENCSGGASVLSAFDGRALWAEDPSRPFGRIFDPATGTVVGRFDGNTPAFSGSVAVQNRGGRLVALDRERRDLWSFAPGGAVATRPLVADGLVFAASADGRVHGVDLATGTARWSAVAGSLSGATGRPDLGLAAADGTLVVPTLASFTAYRVAPAASGSGSPAQATPSTTANPHPLPKADPRTSDARVTRRPPCRARRVGGSRGVRVVPNVSFERAPSGTTLRVDARVRARAARVTVRIGGRSRMLRRAVASKRSAGRRVWRFAAPRSAGRHITLSVTVRFAHGGGHATWQWTLAPEAACR